MANNLQQNSYQQGFKPFTMPKVDLGGILPAQRAPQSGRQSSQVNDLINQMGSFLRPEIPLTKRLGFEQFAAPERQAFKQFGQQSLRPEFEQFTLKPFQREFAATSAVAGPSGRRGQQYGQASTLLEKGFQDQLEEARTVFEAMARENYERQLKDLGLSPTQFTNIGL